MATEKATAVVLRTTDWSESSRIATLWTRELGKVRVVAKGAKRPKSAFDSGLDLLTVCSIVLIRKSSGGLDLLTEAQVVRRFSRLGGDLEALYAGYYVAELLADWTEDHDPHPELFDEALATLDELNREGREVPARVLRFEMLFLRELGFQPALDHCAECAAPLYEQGLTFSAIAGGVVCPACRNHHADQRALSPGAWRCLLALVADGDDWRTVTAAGGRAELRPLLGAYMTQLRGRPPRLLPYLGS